MRQIFWSSGTDVPDDVESRRSRSTTLDVMELAPGEKAAMSLSLPKGFVIVFDPVTHSSLFLDVAGEETQERRNLSLVFADAHAHSGTLKVQPGPGAHFVREQVRAPDAAGRLDSQRGDGQAHQPAPAVPDRDAAAQQPGRSAISIAAARSIPSSGSRSPA